MPILRHFSKLKHKTTKKSKEVDLNYLIIKDRHGKDLLRKGVYSRVVITFLMILIQILIFLFFIIKVQPHIELYFGTSVLFSSLFFVYLSNCRGKNEFKIAWLVPVVFFPIFGILAYIFFHINGGHYLTRKRLLHLKEALKPFSLPEERIEPICKNYPEITGLLKYLFRGGFAPHIDTEVKYFCSGEELYLDLFESIKKAKKFIFIEFFIIEVDETWALLLELLEQKVHEGVEVRVMYDGIGSPMASSRKYQKYLKNFGINSHIFQPLVPFISTPQNNRDHRKIVVIDGDVAYTGGINISNEYFNKGHCRFGYWKDNAICIQGSAIKNLTEMFLQTWNLQTHAEDDYAKYLLQPSPKKNARGVVIPYADDAFNDQDIAEDVYNYIISTAKKYVHITTPYIVIDNQLMNAFIFAARRGVEISVIVPSVPDHYLTFCIGKTYLKTLVENGIHVYLYKKGFIHQKTFISDDCLATVGSINLDYRSLYHHFECGTVMYDCPAIEQIESDFQNTLADCEEMKIEDYKKIPSHTRFLGRSLRVFAPLL